MRLLIIRHGIAISRGAAGVADEERPLTLRGEEKFVKCAKGLKRVVSRPDLIMTSPWRRARRTAEIAAEEWSGVLILETPALAVGGVEDVLLQLSRQSDDSLIAVVGHEPQLGALAARLVGALDGGSFSFKKGGVALIEIEDISEAKGRLLFFIPPRILRAFGD
jgi:phosphohistidine phosphatase